MTVRDLIKLLTTISPDLDTNVYVLTSGLDCKNFNVFRLSQHGDIKIAIEVKE